ncbi:MAG: DNA-directed RNA polymerase subunit A', partial [Candidatus Methanomethylophilaceae archaeon]|nr:DNA-directed RNA polymerase subunit A' [Candidatus Methanomethylophilaceae archaeon]
VKERKESMERMEELGGGTADLKGFSKETAKSASKGMECPYCRTKQVKIKLDKPTTFRLDSGDKTLQKTAPGTVKTSASSKLTPKEVRERLEKISDDDLRALGMNPETCRPEWMVLTALAVPPVTVRPSITLDSGDRSEDDLTHKLVDVLRINQRLGENRDAGAPQLIVEDLWELLQYHVTTYFDNQTSGIPPARHRSGRPLKTLAQRLKGKEGRFRSNLSGKRVNFSARTVISPDPLLSINDVGVPIFAARELTVPLRVNANNIEKVRAIIRRGPMSDKLTFPYQPGANYVIRADGRRIRITERNASEVAENIDVDYTVERQLIEGDVVLFNRQPSLHRMSMMAHRVRIMEGKTFRFNLCDCPPYNADFDGDEMNLHVLQSDEARAEARILMQVQENILSPRYGGPIIGAIHDHITGTYYLTHGDTHFDRFQTSNILFKLPVRTAAEKAAADPDDREHSALVDSKDWSIDMPEPAGTDGRGEPYWTGKQLFSIILPEDFNATFKANICHNCRDGCKKEACEYDAYVKIRDGNLECGTIDVRGIGNSKGKILDRIARDYGSSRAAKFINQVTRLVLGAIMNHGFSTGISDEDIPPEAIREIEGSIEEAVTKVNDSIRSFHEGTFEAVPGRSVKETLEVKIQELLSGARDSAGTTAEKYLGMDNPAVIMAKSGARGSMLNLSQMAGCVGQQSVRGERLSRGYHGRTLSHFDKGDLGAFSKGFCANSYKSGLSPTEFFFHAMGGREGLVDTAVRTSRSGYMQRRLVSALEDLKLMSDGTVRNTSGTIIQFKYGEDGVDPARTVGGKAIDLDDLFYEVLPEDEAEKLIHPEIKDSGDDYATREKDEMDFSDDENEEDIEEGDDDFGDDGGE